MSEPHHRPRVLFVCTHNSARSQMAEALLRARWGDRLQALSAGVQPRGVHPGALAALAEIGLNAGRQSSKSVDQALNGRAADWVVTVCDSAREACPWVPARRANLHRRFDDPSAAPEDEQSAAFRRVRDEIDDWLAAVVPGWLRTLDREAPAPTNPSSRERP